MQSQPILLRPDTILFIYYIEGILPAHTPVPSIDFIGNWVEDDFSFLFFRQPARKTVETILSDYPTLKLLDE
ncbi:MAG: hypothetical protein JRC69_10055 [Deltaproteobacteria bacterium]|nr:hypothetical protein [Deltaproteobacteria bacterium]